MDLRPEHWWFAVCLVCLGVEEDCRQAWRSKTAKKRANNVVSYGTADSPSPLTKGRSSGMEQFLTQKAPRMANRPVCRHIAWLHINEAEEMWQQKTKQTVCHVTCNSKYCVSKPHARTPSCGQKKQILSGKVRQTRTDAVYR